MLNTYVTTLPCRFSQNLRETTRQNDYSYVRVEKEDEMGCLIKGCNFLLKNISDEAFTYHRHGSPEYEFQTADPNIFPYLLVNIGSGVSILKVSTNY